MAYGTTTPRVDPQLQGDLGGGKTPTRGADCAVKVIQGLTRWATRGKTVVGVAEIRDAIGKPTGGLSMADVERGYAAFGVSYRRTAVWADITTALGEGKAIHCAIDYGWVNANAPRLSGDRRFTGNHAIGAYGLEQFPPLDANWVQWLDPLHDGRRGGIPKQIVMARLSQELAAAMRPYAPSLGAIIVTRNPRQ